jgi:tetratricopeptide (TPR) repeat protein
MALAWSPDGRLLASAGSDDTLRLWDVATRKEASVLRGHTSRVTSVAWSPGGERLVSSGWDHTVKVWDPRTGAEVLSIPVRTTRDEVAVAWSPDGTRLAIAGDEGKIELHQAPSRDPAGDSPEFPAERARHLTSDPEHIKDPRRRGLLHARLARWDQAAADFQTFLKEDSRGHGAVRTGWWVAGPYPETLDKPCPPEQQYDPFLLIPGMPGRPGLSSEATNAPETWRPLAEEPSGRLDLGKRMNGAEHVSCYAVTRIFAVRQQEITFRVRSEDSRRIWLNGRLCNSSAAIVHEASVPAPLSPGWNTLLVRMAIHNGRHGLSVRLSEEPHDLLRASLARTPWKEAEGLISRYHQRDPKDPKVLLTGANYFERQLDALLAVNAGAFVGLICDERAAPGRPGTGPATRALTVREVVPHSPAAQSGIRPGDLITAIARQPVPSINQFRKVLSQSQPGQKMEITLERDGKPLSITAIPEAKTDFADKPEATTFERWFLTAIPPRPATAPAERLDDFRQKARAHYQKLLAVEPNDWTYINRYADFLLGTAGLWKDLARSQIPEPIEIKSEGGATLTRQPDGSILASGANPARDAYTFRTRVHLQGTQVLCLEALPDPSLPANGPGRAWNGNFVLSEVVAEVAGKPVPLRPVWASRSQPDLPLSGTVDGKPQTGWGIYPQMGHAHAALFVLETPGATTLPRELTIRLRFEDGPHKLGRFRLRLSGPLEADTRRNVTLWLPLVVEGPSGHEGLAVAHALNDDWKSTADALRIAVARDEGDCPRNRSLLALALYKDGHDQEARDELAQAIVWLKNHSSSADALQIAGRALREINSLDDTQIQAVMNEIVQHGRYRELSQAIQNQPSATTMYKVRAELAARLGRWKEAAADLAKVMELGPSERLTVINRYACMLLLAGDRAAYDRLCRQEAGAPEERSLRGWAANNAVWLFCLAPDAASDYRKLVDLMERAVQEIPTTEARGPFFNTFGAVLYRAGRDEEAMRRFDERLKAAKAESVGPHDWVFLALLNHRLGNAADARRWLEKLRVYKPVADATGDNFWNDLEIVLLRQEVERVFGS